ncbi:MAG TPA: class I SAM-dependent methyltransferase [Isosphaeraceae bacterium]|nr:class I SAM-dependent methyltransferase [Isosphaeraceae bacterium]
MRDELLQTLPIYKTPSQSLWRAFELRKLREVEFVRPILEIGCSDGAFSSLIFDEIDDAIDVNPRAVDRYQRRHGTGGVYNRIHCMDARRMSFGDASYRTVFANCVLEHIPDLPGVLADCCRVLQLGGTLVTTVPLERMNDHLMIRSRWYARWRQSNLVHVYLLSEQGWKDLFLAAGFSSVEFAPYLSGRNCHLWDRIDGVVGLGFGRYKLGAALAKALEKSPVGLSRRVYERVARWLVPHIDTVIGNDACTMFLIARK